MLEISLNQIEDYEKIFLKFQENNEGVNNEKVKNFMSESGLQRLTLSKIW